MLTRNSFELDVTTRREVREIPFYFLIDALAVTGKQSGEFTVDAVAPVALPDEI
jgi:hypothetical protein